MNFSKKTHRVSNIKRFAVISRIMMKHGLGEILDRVFDRNDSAVKAGDERSLFARAVYPSPQRIRLVFEELGPTFVKLGQLMSTRADMFPQDYLEEFKKLQDRVPPVPFEQIRALVEKELKRPISEIFVSVKAGDERSLFARAVYPSPQRIRLVFEELGPTFVKLGQLMSTRADMFPQDYLEEFKKLQDRVPPVPFEQIRTLVEKELKRPISEIFISVKEESLAAASVAQVHLAELAEDQWVVVKVIRPGIDKKIREDIRLMYYFAEKLEGAFEIGKIIGFVNLVKEFERSIFRELDMFIEAGNIERFAQNFKDSAELYIPKVYWDYTSKSVLVMEHIEGIKMDQVDEIQAHDIDPKEIAMIGLRSFSRQLMEFGLFHADPHPGNTIVMYDGRVSLVDFGIIGYLDEKTKLEIANVFLGYAEHNYDLVMDALLDAGLISEETVDLHHFRNDLRDISEPFYGRTLSTISVRDVYDQVMQLLLKYHIRLPRNLMLLFKTFIQAESLGKILGSDASLLEVTRPYARKLLKQGYDTQKLMHNIVRDFRSTRGYLRVFPKLFHDILKALTAGKHQIEIRHSGFQQTNAKIERGINRLTVGLVISASLIAGSLVLDSSQKIMELTVNFLGVRTISITALLGLLGYSLATILGFWLIISIFRSGKM